MKKKEKKEVFFLLLLALYAPFYIERWSFFIQKNFFYSFLSQTLANLKKKLIPLRTFSS